MNSKKDFFELIKKNNQARLGKIQTSRGTIDTPAFMPVGTQGTVKSIFVDDILQTNTQIILANQIIYAIFAESAKSAII